MKTWIALLRGINVSGHKPVKMERLRALCAGLGFAQVRTYVQSGNVIFDHAGPSPSALAGKLRAGILDELGFEVPVLVLPAARLPSVIAQNPFSKQKGIDPSKLHVTFLAGAPAPAALGKLAAISAGRDRFEHVGDVVYLHCPDGYGATRLSNQAIERVLSVEATTRNWKTVNELHRLSRS